MSLRRRAARIGVATAEFSNFAGVLNAALSQHHLSGFDQALSTSYIRAGLLGWPRFPTEALPQLLPRDLYVESSLVLLEEGFCYD